MRKIFFILSLSVVLFASSISVGDSAKDFKLKELNGAKEYTIKAFKSRVVLLNVWASWCGGCKKEMPAFFKLQKEFKNGFALVAVSVDSEPQKSREFLQDVEKKVGFKTPFIVLSDTKKSVAKSYRCMGMPSSYLIDKKGKIRQIIVGSLDESDMKELKTQIKKLLQE